MFVSIGVSVSRELLDARGSPAFLSVAIGCVDMLRDPPCGANECTHKEIRVSWMALDIGDDRNVTAQPPELTH